MRYMSRYDLAQVAQRVLHEYWRLPEAQEHPWNVDPALLADRVLDLKVRYRHLSEDGEIMGLTSYREMEVFLPDEEVCGSCVLDGRTILIERDLLTQASGPGRRNFTIGHECAHHVLFRLFPTSYGDGLSARRALPCRKHRLRARGGAYDWEEWQMDVLSSEILMPEDLIRRNLALAGCSQGFDILNPIWRRQDYCAFAGICKTMGVSKQALSYRLELLGLLGKNQMRCPNAMIDIEMSEEEVV